jgi:Protein of unknown function (DUF2511)
MNTWGIAAAGFALASLAACSSTTGGGSDSAEVSRAEFGNAWPLTVESGTVSCEPPSSVVFTDDSGNRYAVNGTAMSATDYPDIDAIWAPNPEIDGTKIDISPILDTGLDLCE